MGNDNQETVQLLVWPQTTHGPPGRGGLGWFFLLLFGCCRDSSSDEEDMCRGAVGAHTLLPGPGSPSCAESAEPELPGERPLRAGLLTETMLVLRAV